MSYGTCIILDKKYNIANSSCHFGSYGSIWTGPSPKQYDMDLRSFGPYNIILVTDRSIYCHMTLSAMNYLLCGTHGIYFYLHSTFFSSTEQCAWAIISPKEFKSWVTRIHLHYCTGKQNYLLSNILRFAFKICFWSDF
jgi:hypothetical protein